MLWLILETFNHNIYYIEGIEGRDVVDIGGSIGDTAIFYKINGARNIISIEPLIYLITLQISGVNILRGALVAIEQ